MAGEISAPVVEPSASRDHGRGRGGRAGPGGGAVLVLALDDGGTVTASAAGGSPTQQLAKAAAAIRPSVVPIIVATDSGKEVGSGPIMTADGVIMTSSHVVEAAADQGGTDSVTFDSGRTGTACLLGGSASADIAVIKAGGVSGARSARLGSADSLHVGDAVVATGSSLGLRGTVSTGVVSAVHHDIDVSSEQLQTDAAINPGNSGGPLATVRAGRRHRQRDDNAIAQELMNE